MKKEREKEKKREIERDRKKEGNKTKINWTEEDKLRERLQKQKMEQER